MSKSKSFLKVVVISLIAGVISAVLGSVVMMSRGSIESAIVQGQVELANYGWIIMLVGSLCYILIESVTYVQIRRAAQRADQVVGDEVDQWECRLGQLYERARLLNSMFISSFFFIMTITLPMHNMERIPWKALLMLGCIVVCAGFSSVCEIVLISHIQKRDPRKKGDPSDFNFHRVWLESCDEGEKLQAYKAGYHTFVKMQVVYIVLWAMALFYRVYFESGGGAVTMVGAIWVIQTGLYWYQSAKLRKSKLE